MSQHARTGSWLLFAIAAFTFALATLPLGAVAPSAPTNLNATVSGLSVTLTWGAASNNPTQYILQAGFAPGQTALSVPLSGATTTFSASAGAGTYYVRVVAVNTDGVSPPSNEVTVVLTTGCSPPSAPRNLRAMVRGAEVFLFWIAGASGTPSAYSLQAGGAPGQTFAQFATATRTLNATAPGGTYFARVIATSPCGNSPASNEITLGVPGNSAREADPSPGTVLGVPDFQHLIARINTAFPITEANSCPTGRAYEPNPWLNNLVDVLRTYSTRFGYNQKPTKTSVDNGGFPVIAAGDEVAFFRGSGNAEGSNQVSVFDVVLAHCGGSPQITFRDIAPEPAIWTGAGRFTGDQR